MLRPWALLLPAFSISLLVLARPSDPTPRSPLSLVSSHHDIILEKRNGDHHHHAGAPLTVLNETEVTMYHSPTPPSYYTLDFEDEGHQNRHKGLMMLHVVFMCLAFFVSLPVGASSAFQHTIHSPVFILSKELPCDR